MKRLLIGITGSPGTGKSHLAKRLGKTLPDATILELNLIAKKKGLFLGVDSDGAKIVDLKRLSSTARNEARRNKKTTILVGHLVPELELKYDIIVVMRANLQVLEKRLSVRHYKKKKLSDNLVCEALDYCGLLCKKKAKEVYEVETEKEKRLAIEYITKVASGKKARKPKARTINKMGELLGLLKKGQILQVSP
jgi:broad-specificity NMP kinase